MSRLRHKLGGFLAGVLTFALVLPAVPALADTVDDSAGDSAEVTIYHTNDTHGYLEGDGTSIIGLPLVAGLVNSDENAILVDAGDATQGLPLASLTKGNDVIELMNLAGYDLMVPGNHEFDFGTEAFMTNVGLAQFPVISANIYRDGSLLLAGSQEGNEGGHTIIEKNGVRVGFFGLTTTQTATATNPEGLAGVEFTDEVEAAKQEIDHLEAEGADVVIAVAHLGDYTAGAPCNSTQLAEAMTGEYAGKLDAIIDGHSHTVENEVVNDVLIVQTGTGLGSLGKLSVKVASDGEVSFEEKLLTLGSGDFEGVTPDAQVEAKLEEVNAEQETLLSEVIGETPTTLWAGSIGIVAIARYVETNYGNLAADALADAAKTMVQQTGTEEEKILPVVAVENGGGVRSAVSNGTITLGDLVNTFPFSNTVYIKKITPNVLYAMMEQSGSKLDGQDPETGMMLQQDNSGGFLQISGFQVVYNPDAEAGNRVVSITIDGQSEPLDRTDNTTQIFLAGNNYIMSGGSSYSMLTDIPKYAEAGGELETIQSWIEKNLVDGVLQGYQGTEGRISYTGSVYQPKDYTVSVKIQNADGSAYANQEISYRVDGGKGQKGTTDADGILKITVSDGGHGIRVSDSQDEIYVDNYAGFGITDDEFRPTPTLTAPEAGSEIPVAEETPGSGDEENPGEGETPGGGDGQPADDGSENDPSSTSGSENDGSGNQTSADKVSGNDKNAPVTGDNTLPVVPAVSILLAAAVIIVSVKVRKEQL